LQTSRASGHLKVQGMTAEAIVGAVFTSFGSPAAQRLFHLEVLPHLATQLRDPRLIEKSAELRRNVEKTAGGGVLLP
jgi:hypothetical protein